MISYLSLTSAKERDNEPIEKRRTVEIRKRSLARVRP